ncbi:MAG: UDP-3-O-acyl-N-acetylglucosamine deacetylase, partial [Parcubacteria group bacterium]
MFQKTIKKEITVKGIRQSDGYETFIKFTPTESGLWVIYENNIEPISSYLVNKDERRFTSSILVGNKIITMVEHVFSAVNGLGIDNLVIEFGSDEAPFFANSEYFSKILNENILEIKDQNKEYYKINKEIEIKGENGQYCMITPSDDFCIDITIDFDGVIGRQSFLYSFKKTDYLKDVAYARSILTFEIKDINNPWVDFNRHFDQFPYTLPENPRESPYISYTEKEFLTPLSDALEPVRHKLLDFIGDLIFLGKIPLGRFEVYKPGHAFNRKIVETIFFLGESHNLQFEYFFKKIPEINLLKDCVENNIVHKEDVLTHTKT